MLEKHALYAQQNNSLRVVNICYDFDATLPPSLLRKIHLQALLVRCLMVFESFCICLPGQETIPLIFFEFSAWLKGSNA